MIEKTNSTLNVLEFADTSVDLNAKKGRIFTPKGEAETSPSSDTYAFTMRITKDGIHACREVNTGSDFMNNPANTKLFNPPQDRLKGYSKEVCGRVAASNIKLTKADFKLATEFKNWMRSSLNV